MGWCGKIGINLGCLWGFVSGLCGALSGGRGLDCLRPRNRLLDGARDREGGMVVGWRFLASVGWSIDVQGHVVCFGGIDAPMVGPVDLLGCMDRERYRRSGVGRQEHRCRNVEFRRHRQGCIRQPGCSSSRHLGKWTLSRHARLGMLGNMMGQQGKPPS
jgi:hypothetical protein